jgi:glycerol-3-phosphate dehydrogenase
MRIAVLGGGAMGKVLSQMIIEKEGCEAISSDVIPDFGNGQQSLQ